MIVHIPAPAAPLCGAYPRSGYMSGSVAITSSPLACFTQIAFILPNQLAQSSRKAHANPFVRRFFAAFC